MTSAENDFRKSITATVTFQDGRVFHRLADAAHTIVNAAGRPVSAEAEPDAYSALMPNAIMIGRIADRDFLKKADRIADDHGFARIEGTLRKRLAAIAAAEQARY